jgi:hypothetical protein
MKALDYNYDALKDVITIEGINYSGEIFRLWAKELPLGVWFKIIRRDNGKITIEHSRHPESVVTNDIDD